MWDFAHPVVQKPVKGLRVVTSVAFCREDFQVVASSAAKVGESLSAYIRQAALDRAAGRSRVEEVSGSAGLCYFGLPATPSRTTIASVVEVAVLEPGTTYG